MSPMPNTLDILCKYIVLAEQDVRRSVYQTFPAAEEEQITTLYREKLHNALTNASNNGEIASAFLSDLENAGMTNFNGEATQLSRGIIAEVSWHPTHKEKKSGGDFGLVFIKPKIVMLYGVTTIDGEEIAGLLVQAKRKLYNKKCGTLRENQVVVLAPRLKYTSILLYRFSDSANRELEPFCWRLCEGKRMSTIIKWLDKADFPPHLTMKTEDILRKLHNGSIGTTQMDKIESYISPPGSNAMIIEVKWKDGHPPHVEAHVEQKQEQRIHIRQ